MKTQRNLILLTVIPIILSACAGSNLSNQTDLAGTAWNLTAINQDHPLEGTETTLAFKDTQISGKACNLYSGSYQVNGDEISFGPLTQTEMACMEPEGIMAQEQIYLELLRDAPRFELVDDVLTIFIDQQQTLTFEKQQENEFGLGNTFQCLPDADRRHITGDEADHGDQGEKDHKPVTTEMISQLFSVDNEKTAHHHAS